MTRGTTAGRARLLAVAVGASAAAACGEETPRAEAIIVQGESPAATNIPVATDERASAGAYLSLATGEEPPPPGWYATYRIDGAAPGVYRLVAAATPPMEHADVSEFGSFFALSVNGGDFAEIAGSQPSWATSPAAWGDLALLTLDQIELGRGSNSLTFMVDRPTVSTDPPSYRLLLDEIRLEPIDLAIEAVHVGDQAENLGIYRGDAPEDLHVRLNGTTAAGDAIHYSVTDFYSNEVASGMAAIAPGESEIAIALPDLPPGHYRATASLDSSPESGTVGLFARLPDRSPVSGVASRFGANCFVFSTVPPSRLDAFAGAMREMGAGIMRDSDPVPPDGGAAEGLYDAVTRVFHEHGLGTLEFLSPQPTWEITEASAPLPADLRDAYDAALGRASKIEGARSDAVQTWNEPDNDETASTGDQHAAYVKAAALGLADAPNPILTVLSGIAGEENGFQELMLQNGVARYADVWSFHKYPDPANQEDPEFPGSEEQHELRRLHAAETAMWATESGLFLDADPGGELSAEQQAVQARFVVRSAVEDLAAGTDKHFWFIAPPVFDGGVQFGLLDRDFQPWPAFSAHAALAALLGEANFVERSIDLSTFTFRFVFDSGREAVAVLWGAGPTRVAVPVPGTAVEVYDLMGALRETVAVGRSGTVDVEVSRDPIYLVSDARPAGRRESRRARARDVLSAADHVVLSQRFDVANAAPGKANGDAEPPLGYRLGETASMWLDVYNFGDAPQSVTVQGRIWGGWTLTPAEPQTVTVAPRERAGLAFTIQAGGSVESQVDYPLVFEAAVGEERVPPSVSRIQLIANGEPGEQVALSPSILDISPEDGSTVIGPAVPLRARIVDELTGVDPGRVAVEVDGKSVTVQFDPATGLLSSTLRLSSGPHTISIRAFNRAHAPSRASIDLVAQVSSPARLSRRGRPPFARGGGAARGGRARPGPAARRAGLR